MALSDTGDRVNLITGVNAKALDDSGATVVVATSHDAVTDYGWVAIFEVASEKYASGDVVPDSTPPRIQVTTRDFSDADRT